MSVRGISIAIAVPLVGILVACQSMSGGATPDLSSQKAKFSYAIGQQIGQTLAKQTDNIDPDVLALSIRDVFSEAEPKVAMEDQQAAMQVEREKQLALRGQQEAEAAKVAEENLKTGTTFLETNKKVDGVKVTDSGLQYMVIEAGKGAKPKATDAVKVHYKGTLIDGTQFDSSYDRGQPATFPIKGVIPGWTEALQLMPVGSKWKLFIPPALAYGERGRPQIPGNSVLIFEVELLEITGS